MRSRLLIIIKLSLDLLGQRLAELNTPLVEAVDVPDGTLGKRKVLVVDNQSTESRGCDLVSQDGGSRSVAQEGLVRDKVIRRTLCLNLVGGLADHKSLSLGEEVGCKHPEHVSQQYLYENISNLLLVLVIVDRVVALGSHDEISGDELGALVEQLVEGVLGIGSRLTEQNRASGVLDVVATACDGLSVRLHRQLLEISGEPVEILVETK